MSNITRDAREGKVEVRGIFNECAYYKKVCFMGGRGGGDCLIQCGRLIDKV